MFAEGRPSLEDSRACPLENFNIQVLRKVISSILWDKCWFFFFFFLHVFEIVCAFKQGPRLNILQF